MPASLERRNVGAAWAAAAELQVVGLADALALCLLVRDREPAKFWVSRAPVARSVLRRGEWGGSGYRAARPRSARSHGRPGAAAIPLQCFDRVNAITATSANPLASRLPVSIQVS